MDKRYTLIAGVNGCGKTTLYRVRPILQQQECCRVNADEIRRQMGGDWRSNADNIRAGKEAIRLLDEAFAKGISVNQETTLAGHSILERISKAKELGYFIELHYIGVNSPEIAIKRIANRVVNGGHGIPDADVRRRYSKSLENVAKVALNIEELYFYDNSSQNGAIQIAEYKKGKLIDCVDAIPEWFVSIKADINYRNFDNVR